MMMVRLSLSFQYALIAKFIPFTVYTLAPPLGVFTNTCVDAFSLLMPCSETINQYFWSAESLVDSSFRKYSSCPEGFCCSLYPILLLAAFSHLLFQFFIMVSVRIKLIPYEMSCHAFNLIINGCRYKVSVSL